MEKAGLGVADRFDWCHVTCRHVSLERENKREKERVK